MFKTITALLLLVSGSAYAASYKDSNAAQVQLNNASPEGMRKHQLGTMLIKQSEISLKCVYNFSTLGGASNSSLILRDELGQPCVIPRNAIVLQALIDVVNGPTSSGAAQISFGTGASTLTLSTLKSATAIASYTGIVAGTPVDTAATAFKISDADVNPRASITIAPLTAGKLNVHIRYKISD